jgi:hypothetical protein
VYPSPRHIKKEGVMKADNPIDNELDDVLLRDAETEASAGAVRRISQGYDISSDRLLGFLLALNYGEMSIVTCDPWKRKCGGVPRNSFVIVKLSPQQVIGRIGISATG